MDNTKYNIWQGWECNGPTKGDEIKGVARERPGDHTNLGNAFL